MSTAAGTNTSKGVAFTKLYSGNVDTMPNDYANAPTVKGVRRTAVIHCKGVDADATEQTTDFTIPAGSVIHDVMIYVHTVDATETVDIGTEGTSNDPDGFASLLSLANSGLVRPGVTVTTGSNESYFASATRGALLATLVAGSDATTDVGTYVEFPAIIANDDPVSFTCSSGTDTAVFDIIIDYTYFPVEK